jgi:hypothetical protein
MPEPEETAGHGPGHGPPSTRAARCGLRGPYPDTGTKVVPPPGASARISTASRWVSAAANHMHKTRRSAVTPRRTAARQVVPASTDAGQGPGLAAVVILPPGQLIGQRAGYASGRADRRGTQRCGRDRRGDGRAPHVRGQGRARGPCPSRQARPVVLGAHVASRSFPGGFRRGWPPGSPILTFVIAGELARQTTLMYTI